MSDSPTISVVIPTFNRARMVCDCVRAVLKSIGTNFEIVVVDDCSSDDTGEQIHKCFRDDSRVVYTRNGVNKQLGGSRNVGAKRARGKYLLFLDDDNVVKEDLLANIVNDFEGFPDVGIIAPMAINVGGNKDGCIWTLGSNFNRWTSMPKDYGARLPVAKLPTGTIRFPTLYCPNAFAVRKSVHDRVGGFSEDLPFWYDDADYGWRIADLGMRSWILSTAVTFHKSFMMDGDSRQLREVGMNSPWRAFLLGRNRLRFVRRHFNFLQVLSVTFVFAPLSVVYYGVMAIKNGRVDIAYAHLKGYLHGLLFLQ